MSSSGWQNSPSGLPPTALIYTRPLALNVDLSEDLCATGDDLKLGAHISWVGFATPSRQWRHAIWLATGDGVSGSCIHERTGYGVIFPALRLQECGKDAQLLSVSGAMSSLAGIDSTAYGVGLRCKGGTCDISTGRDAKRIKRRFCWFSSASNSNATHLPYEPLGSIKVRKRVIIQKGLLFSWTFLPASASFNLSYKSLKSWRHMRLSESHFF